MEFRETHSVRRMAPKVRKGHIEVRFRRDCGLSRHRIATGLVSIPASNREVSRRRRRALRVNWRPTKETEQFELLGTVPEEFDIERNQAEPNSHPRQTCRGLGR